MKNIYWLVRRELWEHKMEMVWAPIATALLFVGLAAAWAISVVGNGSKTNLTINGVEINLNGKLSAEVRDLLTGELVTGMFLVVLVIAGLASFVIINYCAGSLYDERKDRSILFWKSLPVSDGETVMSKAIMAIIVAPLIALVAMLVSTGLIAVVVNFGIGGTEQDAEVGSLVTTAFWALTSKLLAAYPMQIIWMIPSVGWFMLVSSIARSSPVLWSLAVPIAVLFINEALVYLFQVDLEGLRFISTIRWLAGTVPGSWEYLDHNGYAQLQSTSDAWAYFLQQWEFFNNGRFWIGTGFGVAMIFIATRMRQRSGIV